MATRGRPPKHKSAAAPPKPSVPTPRGATPTPEEWKTLKSIAETACKTKVGTAELGHDVDKCLLVMLKGREIGFPPLASLQWLYVQAQDGYIGLKAEGIRAAVEQSGAGYLQPVKVEADEVVVEACRYGVGQRPDRVQRFTMTQADAARAGLATDDYYRKYPAQTMFARVAASAGRAMFADVLAGASYVPGERAPQSGPVTPVPPGVSATAEEGASASAPSSSTEVRIAEAIQRSAQRPHADMPEKRTETTPEAPQPPKTTAETSPPVSTATTSLTHPVELPKAGGGTEVVLTAGIGRETLLAIGQAAQADPAVKAFARSWMDTREIPRLYHLTEEQGQALIADLRAQRAPRNGDTPPMGSWEQAKGALDALIATLEREQDRPLFEGYIAMAFGKETLGQVSAGDLLAAVDELRTLANNDPAALTLALSRGSREGAA